MKNKLTNDEENAIHRHIRGIETVLERKGLNMQQLLSLKKEVLTLVLFIKEDNNN